MQVDQGRPQALGADVQTEYKTFLCKTRVHERGSRKIHVRGINHIVTASVRLHGLDAPYIYLPLLPADCPLPTAHDSKLFPAIQQEGHGPVIDQGDFHHRPEDARGDLES